MFERFERASLQHTAVHAVGLIDNGGLLKEGTYDCKAAAASAIGELANATDKRATAIEVYISFSPARKTL